MIYYEIILCVIMEEDGGLYLLSAIPQIFLDGYSMIVLYYFSIIGVYTTF